LDAADLAVDVVADKDKYKSDGRHNQQKQSAVTAEDVRSGAKAAASVAAAVGHVAADVTQAIFHGLQQQHQQQQHQQQQHQQQHQQHHTSPHLFNSVMHPEASSLTPNQPSAPFGMAVPPTSEWRTGMFDICSGGCGMVCDAFFCGTCLAYGLQEDLGDAIPLSRCCSAPCTRCHRALSRCFYVTICACTWMSPFWMCFAHAHLRFRIAQRHSIDVCVVFVFLCFKKFLHLCSLWWHIV
jgi:hypothetical protein